MREVFASPQLAIYEVPHPQPILTGPGKPALTRLDHAGVDAVLPAAGSYQLKIRYTRYWRVREGAVCVDRAADGMTIVRAWRPGRFSLAVPEGPGGVLRALVGRGRGHC